MEAKAWVRFVRVTPQKARRVVNAIHGKHALDAVDVLRFALQGAAESAQKLVESVVASVQHLVDQTGERSDAEDLYIQATCTDEGFMMKCIQPRAQGHTNRILKRTSHITVVVGDETVARKKGRTR